MSWSERRRIFYYVFGVSIVLSLMVLLLVRPTYKATAKVVISKTLVTSQALSSWGLAVSTPRYSSDEIKTDVELSKIRPLAEAVIGQYKLKGLFGRPLKPDNFFDATFPDILFSLPYATVKRYKETNIVEIGVVATEPELSASIANSLSGHYIDSSTQRIKSDFTAVRESIELKLGTLRDDYFKQLALSRDIKLKDMSVDLSSETSKLIDIISGLKTELTVTDKELAQLDAEIAMGTKQLKDIALFKTETFNFSKNSRLQSLKNSLDNQLLDMAGQKLQLTEAHPKYKAINKAIDTIKKQMSEEAGMVLSREVKSLNPAYSELSKKITLDYISKEAALARKAVIQKFMRLYEEELMKTPLKSEKFARLEPLLTAYKEMYTKFSQYAVQAATAESISLSKLRVVAPATPPKKKFSPRPVRTLASAVFMAVFLGFAVVFFAGYMDNTVKSQADLRPSELLGRIPYSERLKSYGAVKALADSSKEIAVINEIRDNIFFETTDKKAMIITSPKKGDGKTCTALLLAIVYAREGERVILVDVNGGTAAFFGMSDDMDICTGGPAPTGHPGLDVLSFAPAAGHVNEIVRRLHDTYDRVIIDTGCPKDCVSLDGNVICVAEPYKYEKDMLDRMRNITKDSFVGYVFNKDKPWGKPSG
ncbi:MAG: hypothetical protein HQK96_08895 [Nitrospirae bacterium]|nr:hypothetical protein [Nitrospirota bacterium]